MSSGERKLGKGLIAGLVGGFIGTIVMTQFQNAWSKASQMLKNKTDDSPKKQHAPGEDEKEDSTMKAAGKIARLAGHALSYEEKKKLVCCPVNTFA